MNFEEKISILIKKYMSNEFEDDGELTMYLLSEFGPREFDRVIASLTKHLLSSFNNGN